MDPNKDKDVKDGDWSFPENVEFPVMAKALVKFFKVAETDPTVDNKMGAKKFLDTKIVKVEVALEKSDFFCKQNLLKAFEREVGIKGLAREESLSNPKLEIHVQRKETSEVYLVTKMKHVVTRLEKIVAKQDTFLVEVKEQILSFASKSPTIKININNEDVSNRSENSGGGRALSVKVSTALAPGLAKLDGSKYEKESGRIVCGKCKSKVKPRNRGGIGSVLKYFNSTHFEICGNRDRKRKAKEESEEDQVTKKREEVEKNKKYWQSLSKKSETPMDESDSSEDDIIDMDLLAASCSHVVDKESGNGIIEDEELRTSLDIMDSIKDRDSVVENSVVVDDDDEYLDCEQISEGEEDEFYDCEVETFDIDLETGFRLPFKVGEPADEVCLLLNRLIQDGTLSCESFFYKNIKAVSEHLVNPRAEWDFEICEALQSIQHMGGAGAVNYVVGPLGRNGPRGLPILNYGGPSYNTVKRRKPGVMPVSGIVKHLLLSTLRLLVLSDLQTVTARSHLFAVSMQMDGTMVRAGLIFCEVLFANNLKFCCITGLFWDQNLGLVLGLEEPLTYQDLKDRNFELGPEFLRKNLVTEVDVCVISSLCTKVALSIGYTLQSNSGKSGPQLHRKYTETIKVSSCCESCVRSEPSYLNSINPDIVRKCTSFCSVCWDRKDVCRSCSLQGRRSIYPQLESCFSCLEKNLVCRKNLVLVLALDCYSGNRYLIEKFQSERLKNTRDPEVYLTEPIGEIVHILKTIKSSSSNWFILTPCGFLYNLSMLRTLRDENYNKEVTNALRKVLQKSSVVNRDRQDTDCLVEFAHSVPTLHAVAHIDPWVVHQIVPEKFKLEPSNKDGDLGHVVALGAVNINFVAVLTKCRDVFQLSFLELHSPVKIKVAETGLEDVISMITAEGIIVFSMKKGLMYYETVKGTVVPRIPTKKVDLVSLCKELEVSSTGTVKELKARIKKVLDSKVTDKSIKASEELDNCVIGGADVISGKIVSFVAADNGKRKLMKVDLRIKAGEIKAEVNVKIAYPEIVNDVKVIEKTKTSDFILLNGSRLTILNCSLENIANITFEEKVEDILCFQEEVIFIQEGKIKSDKLINIKDGNFNPVMIVGSDENCDHDGSGKNSSIYKPSSVTNYQSSLLVGSETGKVKVLSKIEAIVDFFQNTFKPAVEGFGLHKKNEKVNQTNLEVARKSHQTISGYLDKCVENIRLKFSLTLPAKFNGPQHSVSAVTMSTVKMAIDSFEVIQENLKLLRKVQNKSNKSDDGNHEDVQLGGEECEISEEVHNEDTIEGVICDCEEIEASEDRVLVHQESLADSVANDGEVLAEEFREVFDDQVEEMEFLKKVNPICTTTEAVEHFHSLAHRKTQVQTVREYISSFAVIVRECAKSMCSWSFQMFSRKGTYYTRPEKNKVPLESIPIVPKLGTDSVLTDEENARARDFCVEYKALPQASTRSFTSKFKAGTLPLQAYRKDSTLQANMQSEDEDAPDHIQVSEENLYVDEVPEYDSSSESDVGDGVQGEDSDEEQVSGGAQLVNENFVTRSGRRVGAPKKYVL